jgi:hypothetical protein
VWRLARSEREGTPFIMPPGTAWSAPGSSGGRALGRATVTPGAAYHDGATMSSPGYRP